VNHPELFCVTLENFLGDRRAGLLEFALEHEQQFLRRPSRKAGVLTSLTGVTVGPVLLSG